jgi:SAM-dependent methyltransferase
MDAKFVEVLRSAETDIVLAELRSRKPLGASIVEIGGGAGWQAQRLTDAGYTVRSFDVPSSEFTDKRVFPIEDYDGRTIPAPAASFDVIFSSNALEHIPGAEAFQGELRRVMKPDGVAIHIVPSATWRAHTSLAHYLWLAKTTATLVGSTLGWGASPDLHIVAKAASRRSGMELLSRIAVSPRHGEKGNALSELWHFSRFGWAHHFQQTGWRILSRYPNRLHYTGYGLLDARLPIARRKQLSPLLGSACHVYVLSQR